MVSQFPSLTASLKPFRTDPGTFVNRFTAAADSRRPTPNAEATEDAVSNSSRDFKGQENLRSRMK